MSVPSDDDPLLRVARDAQVRAEDEFPDDRGERTRAYRRYLTEGALALGGDDDDEESAAG